MQADGVRQKGEVAGSFLLGLIESFASIYAIASDGLDLQLPAIDSDSWHPHELLISTLNKIERAVPDHQGLFFRAGMHFVRIWYEQGPGREMVRSTLDWLRANQDGVGYNSVVRGGSPEEVGWCRMRFLDERIGVAVFENVMPLAPEYIRGVFYGGCLLFDDVDYVDVAETHEPYDGLRSFLRTMVTVRFRLKPAAGGERHQSALARPADEAALADLDPERLAWQYRSLAARKAYDDEYYRSIGRLLEHAVGVIQHQKDAITKLSNTDPLTGIPNLRIAQQRLEQEQARAQRHRGRYAVLFVDLDGFKLVNDSHGHGAGDYVLKATAIRAASCLRRSDTIARKGGDEFLIVVPEVRRNVELETIANKVIAAIGKPIYYHDLALTVGASVGIAVYPDHARDAAELVERADRALYWVKRNGKNACKLYGEDCAEAGPA